MLKKTLGYLLLFSAFAGLYTPIFADNKVTQNQVENYLSGKFNQNKHPAFIKVPAKYANRKGFYLRLEAFDAYKRMYDAARKDKVKLVIRSAARNFDYQKRIWNNKWYKKRKSIPNHKSRVKNILQYNSMPGTSRHHWGTEVDLNSFNNKWFAYDEGLKIFNWLNANAHKYGFCRPYTAKNSQRPTGHNEEKWHWSYTPLSKQMLNDAKGLLNDRKITGFYGSEHASSLNIVENYIFGVDPSCR